MKTNRLRLAVFLGAIVLVWLLINLNGILTNPPVTGKVLDADTMKPIEGAVVMVEWTKTHGIGEHWTESYKVAEVVTDKNGKYSLPGCFSSTVNVPDVTVYKKGYVAWSSRWVFPDWRNRTDFKWENRVFKLEHFKPEYTHIDHTSFIDSSINIGLGSKNKESIKKEIRWEELEASKERTKRDTLRKLQ